MLDEVCGGSRQKAEEAARMRNTSLGTDSGMPQSGEGSQPDAAGHAGAARL